MIPSSVRLSELLADDGEVVLLSGARGDEVLLELAEAAVARGWTASAKDLVSKLLEREVLGTTAVGEEIAIPHAKLDSIEGVRVAVGLAPQGVEFGARDLRRTRLFFLVLSSPRAPSLHIRVLAQVSRVAKSAGLKERLIHAAGRAQVLDFLRESETGEGA